MLSLKCFPQIVAPNIGFENGTFDHWECSFGTIDTLGNIVVYPGTPIANLYTIFSQKDAAILDPFGQFSVSSPNGSNYCIMLGDTLHGNSVQRISYTLTVPATGSNSIIFNYAVVLQNPNHLYYQQPKFTLKVFDVTDNTYLDCPAFNFISSGNLPGFKSVGDVFYKDWSAATIDLKNYNGKDVRLEFTVNHCSYGAHFGYAYLDVDENIGFAISGNAYCKGQKTITVSAPPGFASYTWYSGDLSKQLGTGQSLRISPPPPDLSKYAVFISPYDGLGCPDTLYTVVNKIDNDFSLSVLDTINSCPGTSVDLTSPDVTAGSSAGMTFTYFTDSLATTVLAHPGKVTAAGTYFVKGVNIDGCTNTLPVYVGFDMPVIKVMDPLAVTYPATVDLSKTYKPQPGLTYKYYSDAGATKPLKNYAAVAGSGTYYISATNKTGCIVTEQVTVTINPPPHYAINAPNTFTPNNDGINDHFTLSIKGYVTFVSLRIYDRSGTLVYTATAPDKFWDGNLNGRSLPVGVYYWLFEGLDTYNHTKINQSAFITLLR